MIKYKIIKISISLLLIAIIFSTCKSPYDPWLWDYPELTELIETENFIFHFSSGANVETQRQEAFHDWAISQLGITLPKKIDFYKYNDRVHMKAITGKETNGWADPTNFAIHTIWSWDNHECVHCYTSLIGRPSDFLNEGIAVSMSTDPFNGDYEAKWQNSTVHFWAKKYKNEGTLLPLDTILETNNFRSYDSGITYPESGSFVRFLIDKYGIDRLKSFFQQGNRMDSIDTMKQAFLSIFRFTIEQAENEWLQFLDYY